MNRVALPVTSRTGYVLQQCRCGTYILVVQPRVDEVRILRQLQLDEAQRLPMHRQLLHPTEFIKRSNTERLTNSKNSVGENQPFKDLFSGAHLK